MNFLLRLTGLAAICHRFVLQSRSTSAPLLDPRRRTRATRWFVLAFTDALRRSPDESSQISEKLSLPCYRDRPSRIPPSLHSLGQFLVSPKIQFVVRDLSIFGTTLFTVFFQRVHSAYSLIRLPWRIVKKYIYILWNAGKATTGLATNLHGQVPQILFIAQLTLSRPAFYVYRRLAELYAGSPFLSLGAVLSSCRRLLSTSAVRQAPIGCRCSSGTVLFFISLFLHLFRFAGMPLHPLIVRIRLEIWKEVVFSFVAFLMLFPAVSISNWRIALQKRYTFLRPGFEGFLPSPPRLAAILAWLSSYIVRFYYLSPF